MRIEFERIERQLDELHGDLPVLTVIVLGMASRAEDILTLCREARQLEQTD